MLGLTPAYLVDLFGRRNSVFREIKPTGVDPCQLARAEEPSSRTNRRASDYTFGLVPVHYPKSCKNGNPEPAVSLVHKGRTRFYR